MTNGEFDNLLDFRINHCADCSAFDELEDIISDAKIENNRNECKGPKFTPQIYVFVNQRLMDFPQGKFDYETLATIDFFESIHKIINVQIHLQHLHVTGKTYNYAHNFCNMKVRENQNQFSCITHNFLWFDMFFLTTGIRLSV